MNNICFHYPTPYKIPDNVFEKLITRLHKKIPKMLTLSNSGMALMDITTLIDQYLYLAPDKRLSQRNSEMIIQMKNAISMIPAIVTNAPHLLSPEHKQHVAESERNKRFYIESAITRTNWDKSDPLLHEFFKTFIDRL